jgi:hypothetical protein
MKRIIIAILLTFSVVSVFAQGTGFDGMVTFGNKMGTFISISPKKMKGSGIFVDWKFYDGYTSEINKLNTIETVTRSDEYYTWQTNYGSYTRITEKYGTLLYQEEYVTHSNLSLGIIIPTNKDQLRFYLGAGAEIKKIKYSSFLNHYHSIEENTYYSTINRYYHNYSIGQNAGKPNIKYPDVLNYTLTPNITYGIIYGKVITLSAGFDTKIHKEGIRTEFFMGIGIRML